MLGSPPKKLKVRFSTKCGVEGGFLEKPRLSTKYGANGRDSSCRHVPLLAGIDMDINIPLIIPRIRILIFPRLSFLHSCAQIFPGACSSIEFRHAAQHLGIVGDREAYADAKTHIRRAVVINFIIPDDQ